ncbi:hypothetical protein DPMN_022582 [Dreissena polymorpha]|uniref:Uncharacterized protein n=1 Tax=Dreissena polymorpha TaxID=45954 RepID=A0A9D4NKL3_DREPO|nr:hypothetical protein DPMN_022582 [Dreissena polymorpha]
MNCFDRPNVYTLVALALAAEAVVVVRIQCTGNNGDGCCDVGLVAVVLIVAVVAVVAMVVVLALVVVVAVVLAMVAVVATVVLIMVIINIDYDDNTILAEEIVMLKIQTTI